jgi:predicted patatin/cPLA2 family phospholipase
MNRFREFILEQERAKHTPLIKNLFRKKELLEQGNPEHESIRSALLVMGGGMRGVYGAGVVTGLEKAGFHDVFDVAAGVSAGAADIAYFLAGQAEYGTPIYYENLTNKEFINLARVNKIMDIDYIDHIIRSVKPLDQDRMRRSRTAFYVGVTNARTGRGEMINAKEEGVDVIALLRASCALPVLYNKSVTVNGEEYCDGAIGHGIPLDFVLDRGCTDILLVFNSPVRLMNEKRSKLEHPLFRVLLRKFTPEFRTATVMRNELYNRSLEALRGNSNVNIGIIAPTSISMSGLSKDSKAMQMVARQAEAQVRALFSP